MQRKRVSPSARALLIAAVLASGAAHAADRLPQTPTDLAKGRGEMTPAVDAFAAKSTKVSRPAHELPLPPPQLPYTYGGSGLLDGKPVLFLERESRALAVRVGMSGDLHNQGDVRFSRTQRRVSQCVDSMHNNHRRQRHPCRRTVLRLTAGGRRGCIRSI